MTDEEFLLEQDAKIADQHRGGRSNNAAVDFERSYIALMLARSIVAAIRRPSMLATVVTHQFPARVDDVRIQFSQSGRLFQLKSGDWVR